MRTYSRKRTEHKELENVMDVCRLCLEKPNEFVPIYSEGSTVSSSLALRILVCVGLEISNEVLLPNKICKQCLTEIEKFYLFRKKCAKSYEKLKSHIQAVKAKECKDNQNLMFTINSDGSILLRDGNKSLFAGDEPLVTLTKIHDEAKETNQEVLNMLDQCGVKPENLSVVEYTIDPNQLSNEVKEQGSQQLPNHTNAPLSPLGKEKIVPEAKTAPDPELSEFLSTMLTELGILTRHADGVLDLGPKTSRTLELETKDGKNITFALVEECDETEQDKQNSKNNQRKNKNEQEFLIQNSIGEKVELVSAPKGCNWQAIAKCGDCGKMFANRGVLARHRRNVHARLTPHACALCGKQFAQKEVMRRHLLVHQEKRPFQCDKCPKSFTQRSALETHSRLHRPPQDRSLTLHSCPQCSKVFFYASGLSRHLLSHTNTQISCAECGRTFADKSSLRRHERTLGHLPKEVIEDNRNEILPKIDTVYTESKSVPQTNSVYIESALVVPAVSSSDTGG